jgi:hypothetical protein
MTADATRSVAVSEIAASQLLPALFGAPLFWAAHLALSYFLVALDCGTGWDGARSGIVLATTAGVVMTGGVGVYAWHLARRMSAHGSPGEVLDPPESRAFIALGGALLSVLFAGAILMAGVSALFLPMCG